MVAYFLIDYYVFLLVWYKCVNAELLPTADTAVLNPYFKWDSGKEGEKSFRLYTASQFIDEETESTKKQMAYFSQKAYDCYVYWCAV